QLALGVELVGAEHPDRGMIRMPGRFRRMRRHRPKAFTVSDEVRNRQLLVTDNHHIVIEPSPVDLVPSRLVHCPDVDAGDLDADLWPHLTNLEHLLPSHP